MFLMPTEQHGEYEHFSANLICPAVLDSEDIEWCSSHDAGAPMPDV